MLLNFFFLLLQCVVQLSAECKLRFRRHKTSSTSTADCRAPMDNLEIWNVHRRFVGKSFQLFTVAADCRLLSLSPLLPTWRRLDSTRRSLLVNGVDLCKCKLKLHPHCWQVYRPFTSWVPISTCQPRNATRLSLDTCRIKNSTSRPYFGD